MAYTVMTAAPFKSAFCEILGDSFNQLVTLQFAHTNTLSMDSFTGGSNLPLTGHLFFFKISVPRTNIKNAAPRLNDQVKETLSRR